MNLVQPFQLIIIIVCINEPIYALDQNLYPCYNYDKMRVYYGSELTCWASLVTVCRGNSLKKIQQWSALCSPIEFTCDFPAPQHSARSVKKPAALSFHTAHDQIEITRRICSGDKIDARRAMQRKVCQAAEFSHLKVVSVWCVGCVHESRAETSESTLQEDAPAIMEAELKLASGGRLPPFPHLAWDVYPFRIFLYNNFFYLVLQQNLMAYAA